MSMRGRGRKFVVVAPWKKSYSVSIEVDVAKIVGILALFAFATFCTDRMPNHTFPGVTAAQAIWRFLLPMSDNAPVHRSFGNLTRQARACSCIHERRSSIWGITNHPITRKIIRTNMVQYAEEANA
jgi:hypothetical protein